MAGRKAVLDTPLNGITNVLAENTGGIVGKKAVRAAIAQRSKLALSEQEPVGSSFSVPSMRIGKLRLHIVGDSPLLVNRFDEKTANQILSTQKKEAKQGKEAKDPVDCFARTLYVLPGTEMVIHDDKLPVTATGRFGFPAIGFKASAVRAGTDVDLKMTDLRRAFHIKQELVEILGPPPRMRMDMVRLPTGVADVRFRGEFVDWHAYVLIHYNANAISPAQLFNCFMVAGFGVGVGEWRPDRKGMLGMFHVDPKVEHLGYDELTYEEV